MSASDLTIRQRLILFLISSNSNSWGIYYLVKYFERYDFPWDSNNLEVLLRANLVKVSKLFDNGTPRQYEITEEGKKTLCENFDPIEIIDFLKTFGKDNLLLQVVEKYIERGEPCKNMVNGDE